MRIFYTDGSAGASNMVAGGWALIEIEQDVVTKKSYGTDFSIDVTNNKMELRAAIEAARLVTDNEWATIHSDSQYVIKGITEWVFGWKKNGWKTSKKEDVLNKDLWIELLSVVENKNLKWVWVRGHSTDRYNHLVDKLSKLCYLDPSKIEGVERVKEKNSQLIVQPNVGDIIFFEDSSKKYTVILNDVRVAGMLGFFARLLSNYMGHELDFFTYDDKKINKIENPSTKEKQLSFKAISGFSDHVGIKVNLFKDKCVHDFKKEDHYMICSVCGKNKS